MIEELKKAEQDKIEEYANNSTSLGNTTISVIDFIKEYKPILNQLKDKDREYWVQKNDLVTKALLAQLIDTLKEFLKNPALLNIGIQNHPHGTILNSFQVAYDAVGTFEMSEEVRKYYNEQLELFDKMKGTLKSDGTNGKSGCYIATMAYGDYNHPQVIELRNFRDNVLSKNYVGRAFIQIYYAISPRLVMFLKNNIWVNKQIRKVLDQLINKLK